MTCYKPHKGFMVGFKPNGKRNMIICSSSVQFVYSMDKDFNHFAKRYEPLPESLRAILVPVDGFLHADMRNPKYPVFYCLDYVHIPCGQCKGCRVDRSKEWANRMMMEASYYERNCFITLTYDDEHLPWSKYYAEGDPIERRFHTLKKKDFQDFMKRLRDRVSVYDPHTGKVLDYSKVRFYACGEYGTESTRPHYHAVIFNWCPDDLRYHTHDLRGYNLYTSETLSQLWPKGYHYVGFLNWQTCAYVARYVTKKLGQDFANFYRFFHIEPEFSLMSRKPGLARRYYDEHKDVIYQDDKTPIISLSTIDGGLNFDSPRYFDSLLEVESPELYRSIKDVRSKNAENIKVIKLSKTQLDYYEMLNVEEKTFSNSIKALKRL